MHRMVQCMLHASHVTTQDQFNTSVQEVEGQGTGAGDILRHKDGSRCQHSCGGPGSASVCVRHGSGWCPLWAHRLRLHTRPCLPQDHMGVRTQPPVRVLLLTVQLFMHWDIGIACCMQVAGTTHDVAGSNGASDCFVIYEILRSVAHGPLDSNGRYRAALQQHRVTFSAFSI